MKLIDDRTQEQKKTHTALIIGTDTFLSGWREAENGNSYAVWACKPEDKHKVYDWVSNRSEMKRVRFGKDPYYPNPNCCAHCHIYVVTDNHPARNQHNKGD